MSERQSLTSVSALGVALADYDTAIFSLSVEGRGKSGPKAKDAARPAINALNAALKALEKEGVAIDRDALTTELSVNPETEYDRQNNRQKRVGYLATYALSFKTETVDRASEIFDRLSSIEGVQADSPDFRVKDAAALQKAAFADAKAKIDRRFADECEALGITASDCALASYQTRYDESESAGARPMRAMAMAASAAPDSAPVEIKAGKACIKVTVTATYDRKRD